MDIYHYYSPLCTGLEFWTRARMKATRPVELEDTMPLVTLRKLFDARSEGGSIFLQKKVWIFRAVVFFKEGVVF